MSNMVPDSVIVDSMRKQMDEKKPDEPNEQDMQGNYQATVLPVPDSENNTASRNTENYKQAAANNNYSQERDSSLPANQANLPIETTQPGTQLPMEQQKNANREPGNNDIPNDPATDNR